MIRVVVCVLTFWFVAATSLRAEAQQAVQHRGHVVQRPLVLPSQRPSVVLPYSPRYNQIYVVPYQQRVYVPRPYYGSYYPAYRPSYYYYPRVIIRRSRAPGYRAPTPGSHYFGDPHASQYFPR